MLGALFRTSVRIWILFAIIGYIFSDMTVIDVLKLGLASIILTIVGFVPGFIITIFENSRNNDFKYLSKPKFGAKSTLYDPSFPGGKATVVLPQPFPVETRIGKVDQLIPEDLQDHWEELQVRHEAYASAIRQVLGVMAASPSTPAATVPGGHRGATVLEHTFNVWRKMLEEVEAFEYTGMKDKTGTTYYALSGGEKAPPYKFTKHDPLPFLAAIAHDIGKISCYRPGEGGEWEEVRPKHGTEGAKLLRRLKTWELVPREESRRLIIAVGFYHELSKIPLVKWIDDRARALACLVYHVDNLTGIGEGKGDFDRFIENVVVAPQDSAPQVDQPPKSKPKKSDKYRVNIDVANGLQIIQSQNIVAAILEKEFFIEKKDYFEMVDEFCNQYPGLLSEVQIKKIHDLRKKRNSISHENTEITENDKITYNDVVKIVLETFYDLVDRASGTKGNLRFSNYTPIREKIKDKVDQVQKYDPRKSDEKNSVDENALESNAITEIPMERAAEEIFSGDKDAITNDDMPFDDTPTAPSIPDNLTEENNSSPSHPEYSEEAVEINISNDGDDDTGRLDSTMDDDEIISTAGQIILSKNAINSTKPDKVGYKYKSWLYINEAAFCRAANDSNNISASQRAHYEISPDFLESNDPSKVSEFARRLMVAASRRGALMQEWNGAFFGATSAIFKTSVSKKKAEEATEEERPENPEDRTIIIRANLFGAMAFNMKSCPYEPIISGVFSDRLQDSSKISKIKELTSSWKEPLSKEEEATQEKMQKEKEKVEKLLAETTATRQSFMPGDARTMPIEDYELCVAKHPEHGTIFRVEIVDKYFDPPVNKKVVKFNESEYYYFPKSSANTVKNTAAKSRSPFMPGYALGFPKDEYDICVAKHPEHGNIFKTEIVDKYFNPPENKKILTFNDSEYYFFPSTTQKRNR